MVGLIAVTALQLIVGLPAVPAGHKHAGRCPEVWQSALLPHSPGEQMSKQRRLMHVVSKLH